MNGIRRGCVGGTEPGGSRNPGGARTPGGMGWTTGFPRSGVPTPRTPASVCVALSLITDD